MAAALLEPAGWRTGGTTNCFRDLWAEICFGADFADRDARKDGEEALTLPGLGLGST